MTHEEAYAKFKDSMEMNYERWHDGTGYDLEAFDRMSPQDRESILEQIRTKHPMDHRDVELLNHEGSEKSVRKLKQKISGQSIETRVAALRALIDRGEMSDEIIDEKIEPLLDHTIAFDGLSGCLDLAEDHPGPKVTAALLRNARRRPEVAVHYAAMLYYHAGLAKEAFDWAHRPFFLQFGEDATREEREAAFTKLCKDLGVNEKDV